MAPKAPTTTDIDNDTNGLQGLRRGKDADVEKSIQEEDEHPNFSLCRQLTLSAGLMACDGSLVFMQLSMLPCLQTLGVPVSLVTSPGLVSGPLALMLLPVVGWVSDGGSNPHRRKKMVVVLTALIFVAGHSLVSSACCVHLWHSGLYGLLQETNNTFTTSPNYSVTESISYWDVHVHAQSETTANAEVPTTDDDPLGLNIPLAGLLGILGFIFIDMAYDLNSCSLKSFILASTAKRQQVSLLIVGVLMSAIGGCIAAFLGIFDVSAWLGGNMEQNAVPANTLMKSVFFDILVLVCLLVTMLSAPSILPHSAGEVASSSRNPKARRPDYGTLKNNPDNADITETEALLESCDLPVGSSETKQAYGRQTYQTDSSSEIEDSVSTTLSNAFSYSIISEIVTGRRSTSNDPKGRVAFVTTDIKHKDQLLQRSKKKVFSFALFLKFLKQIVNKKHRNRNILTSTKNVEPQNNCILQNDCNSTASSSTASSGKTGTLKSAGNNEHFGSSASCCSQTCWKFKANTRKLVLICTSMFFIVGAWQSFNISITDYLGKVMYGGDPEADPTSQSYAAYQQGMHTGSRGILMLNITYVVVNLLQRKLLAVVGPKVEYLVVCAMQFGLLTALQYTDNEIVFYVTSVFFGILRSAMFTIPYMLTNDICQEEAKSPMGKGSAKVGFAMALLTLMVALSNIVVSSLTGPLIDTTGDPASPMYYAITCTAMAGIVFAFT